jgi:Zn-dependent M28 family amino/carboxypeptidase
MSRPSFLRRRARACTRVVAALTLALPGAAHAQAPAGAAALRPALESITADGVLARTRVLASDAFEGRGPGTRGEDSTVAYLTREFQRLGLAPGNPDGTYVQDVTLVGYTGRGSASFTVGGRSIALEPLKDVVAVARHAAPENVVRNSEVVFVGYGVVAPEYGWNDYADVDVKGKTVVILINDPPVRRAGAAAGDTSERALDPNVFRGRAMTYYGRWTYKYEEATRQGAAAAIIVHETGPAGYPWEVVSGSWGQENFDIRSPGGEPARVTVEAWMTNAKARELLSAAGQDFDALKRAARTKGFRAVPLAGATADLRVQNTVREVRSRNVVARLEGSDPRLKDQHVIYSAHWDHFGRDTTRQGDQIFNGALDNASGTAALVQMAEAFTRLPQRPRRSLLFLAVTAEERGLLGAKYYAENPLYPHATTVANVNMDGVNQWGRTRDMTVVGLGNSTLDDELAAVLRPANRVIRPDPEPEKGFFYRSDHFEFAKKGVPALYTDAGVEYVGRPPEYGQRKREQYEAEDYHKPSDEIKPDWDLSGAVEDLRALFQVGYRVANGTTWPTWKPGTEFRATREAMLKSAPAQPGASPRVTKDPR